LLNSEAWTSRDGTDTDAEDELDIELMTLVQASMQWPYETLFNCYWAGWEIYTP